MAGAHSLIELDWCLFSPLAALAAASRKRRMPRSPQPARHRLSVAAEMPHDFAVPGLLAAAKKRRPRCQYAGEMVNISISQRRELKRRRRRCVRRSPALRPEGYRNCSSRRHTSKRAFNDVLRGDAENTAMPATAFQPIPTRLQMSTQAVKQYLPLCISMIILFHWRR